MLMFYRFLNGWWILPSAALGAALCAVLIWFAVQMLFSDDPTAPLNPTILPENEVGTGILDADGH